VASVRLSIPDVLAVEWAALNLRAAIGITWDEFDVDELRQLDPNLSREYVKGILIRENGHTTNPIGWSTVWPVHSSATGAALSAGARLALMS